jgi:2C-methyl-D-erythritol 2,4-cyclodiphosphate synthase
MVKILVPNISRLDPQQQVTQATSNKNLHHSQLDITVINQIIIFPQLKDYNHRITSNIKTNLQVLIQTY